MSAPGPVFVIATPLLVMAPTVRVAAGGSTAMPVALANVSGALIVWLPVVTWMEAGPAVV